MDHFHSRAALAVIAAISIAGAAPAQSTTLPRLVPAFTTHLIDASPKDRLTPIRVGANGSVLFVTNTDTKALLLLVDSTGKERLRFGRTGEGPGEVTMPRPLAVLASGMVVWDPGSRRVSEWDLNGKSKNEKTVAGSSDIVDLAGDDYLAVQFSASKVTPVAINRATGSSHELMAPNDSFYKARFENSSGQRQSFAPIAGSWDGGFIVADAAAYQVGLYTAQGKLVRVLRRDLPAQHASLARTDDFIATMMRRSGRSMASTPPEMIAKMREQAGESPIPQITPGGAPRTDGQHRLWIVGMEGDSAFADLFTSERFIGRLHLPCHFFNGFWSVSGTWLALACVPDDPNSAVDAVVKLFKIKDGK